MLNFDPERPAPDPVDAATLLVVRAAAGGIELFFVRRHAKSPFLGGAVVFPGGKLDPADRGFARANGVAPRALEVPGFAADADHALALAVCACRESLEEAGILPASPSADGAAVERIRAELGSRPLAEALGERTIDTRALVPFARWVTPKAESRRYDARFFLAAAPEGQRGRHDDHETVSGVWATPERMLAAFLTGDVFLAPPTLRAIELLLPLRTVDGALALAAEQSLLPICPTFVPGDPPMLAIPGDPQHEEKDRRVAGGTRFVLRDGRFVSEQAD